MKVLDLFSGIGGFSLGLERAGMKTVAFCEVDPKCREVLRKHWPVVPIYEDIRSLHANQIHERIDVICGGFPCQDISVAGKGEGLQGERSGLWWEFHRLIKEATPKYAIIENVAVLRSRGLDQVLRSLSEIGYDAEWHCITAASVGAPHRRDRIWVIASRRQDVANPTCLLCNVSDIYPRINGKGGAEIKEIWKLGGSCETLSDSLREGLERYRNGTIRTEEEQPSSSNNSWWSVEPNVGRVAHGVPGRVDRLKQLGNAVVPQIPELIGRAIMGNLK